MGACIHVTGGDAAGYLQSQFSNDLRQEVDNPATYGLFLDLKGKVRADAFICQHGPESFDVISYGTEVRELEAMLYENLIADDVTLESRECEAQVVAGSAADSWMESNGIHVPAVQGFAMSGETLSFHGRRMAGVHYDILFPSGKMPALPADCGLPNDLELERILACIPAVPIDLGPDDLPQEGGVETIAVSFEKGCFLGQEVMARLKAMGRVNRRLYRVAGEGSPPLSGEKVFCEEEKAGDIRSCCPDLTPGRWVGIAMLLCRLVEREDSARWWHGSGSALEIPSQD